MSKVNIANPIIIGRLTSEPVFSCRGSDKIVTFRLVANTDNVAYSKEYNIISRGKQASVCNRYLKVGTLCCIEGRYNSSGDSIIAEHVTFLSKVYSKY
jgi:single-stranded DNA-binding protein